LFLAGISFFYQRLLAGIGNNAFLLNLYLPSGEISINFTSNYHQLLRISGWLRVRERFARYGAILEFLQEFYNSSQTFATSFTVPL
jgi:hypothetical protein